MNKLYLPNFLKWYKIIMLEDALKNLFPYKEISSVITDAFAKSSVQQNWPPHP